MVDVLLVAGRAAVVNAIAEHAAADLVVDQVPSIGGAIERLGAESFDLIVLDLGLAAGDERAVLRRVLAARGAAPVVLLVEPGNHEVALEVLGGRVQDYLFTDSLDARLLEHALRHSVQRGRGSGASQVAHDVEARERAYAARGSAHLAGRIAHDFNNLLGAVLTYATLAERRCDDATVLADLTEIRAVARRGVDLTRDLLAFAATDALDAPPLDLTVVVRDSAAMLERAVGDEVALKLEFGAEPAFIRMSAREVEQILLNLALNAGEAMPDGGVLTISVDAPAEPGTQSGEVELFISDTGTGMPAGTSRMRSGRSSRPNREATAPGSAWPRCTGSSGRTSATSPLSLPVPARRSAFGSRASKAGHELTSELHTARQRAVHQDVRTAGSARRGTGDEDDRAGDFVRCPHPPGRVQS